jgi:REP element-mobilizing transposase RayT
MPKAAREKSRTGIYHVMLRGVNRQQIFEEKKDYYHFLQLTEKYKEKHSFTLYGYCLMENHVHMLIKEGPVSISDSMRDIGGGYASWYNVKYDRVGHLLQSRFKSECVTTAGSLLRVIRYIHQNPVKAGICQNVSDYRFSSYSEYVRYPKRTDTEIVLKYVPINKFIEFNNTYEDEKFLDLPEKKSPRLTEDKVKSLLKTVSGCTNITEFQALPKDERRHILLTLKKDGASIRQLNRLTGESRNIIQRLSA